MRLKTIYISQYKNLKDFTLTLDGDSFIDVFVGKNATGKSNLFEVLIEIFHHLYNYDKEKEELDFDYSLGYSIGGKDIEIVWKSGKFKINGRNRKTIGKTPLPDNVLIYYSGHNDTVKTLVDRYEDTFRKKIKKADIMESRKFFGIGADYKELLLAAILLQPETNIARRYITQKLGIVSISPEIRLMLKRPVYAENNVAYDIDDRDNDRYWKVEGITKTFLDRLNNCISLSNTSPVRSEGYFPSEDKYINYYSIERIRQEFSEHSAQEIFRQFENLKTLGMLGSISISLILDNEISADISYFSDGQFQSVYIYSIVELFKDLNCITLLDEPDSFLHPEWQIDFLNQVFDIAENAAKQNHVLISSHSAATLCKLDDQNINLFSLENSKVTWSKRTKKEIINELSNSYIQYSEDESKLLIDNVIRSSLRPILFVEGPSDVSILNTAYSKLFPGADIPVLIQDAFDRGFIRTLFARDDIFREYPDKIFFALFDFDDAYDDWRKLGGELRVDDVTRGLCRELSHKNAFAFLMPIPKNNLRDQVWDDDNPVEKAKPNCHFCIEHIFWGIDGLEEWFRLNDRDGLIHFKGHKHKVRFATEIVPDLDSQYFEVFRPIFEFIEAICEQKQAA